MVASSLLLCEMKMLATHAFLCRYGGNPNRESRCVNYACCVGAITCPGLAFLFGTAIDLLFLDVL